jgi:hypothetical protein
MAACTLAEKPPPKSFELAGTADRDGKYLVAVIDTSGSMESGDPRHFNELGAHLGISLGGSFDNFGAVSFNSQASVLSRLQVIGDRMGRRRLHDQVSLAPRSGQTNYVAALKWAHAMLSAASAPPESAVVLLTDGKHNVGGTEEDVMQALAEYHGRDWRIYTVGLGEGADSLLLQNIAVATRGVHFPVSRAEDLMTAFLTIMGQVHNFMFFDGAPEPVQLLAGTTRVAYVVIKRSPDATITSVMRNGLAVDPRASFFSKYPEFVDPKVDLEIATVENPSPGLWDIGLQGDAIVGAILQKPPFGVRLDESILLSEYYEGEEIDLALVVEGGTAEVVDHVRKRGSARASIRAPFRKVDLQAVDLQVDAGPGDPIRFRGRATAALSRPGQAELQTIEGRFTFREKAGGSWRREVRVSIMVRPGKRPGALRVSPALLDLGSRWSDSGEAGEDLLVSSTGAPLKVAARGGAGSVRIQPASFTAGDAETRIRVSVDPAALPPGTFESAVELAASRERGDVVERAKVPVKVRVARLSGLKEGLVVDLGERPPGEAFQIPFPLRIEGADTEFTVASPEGLEALNARVSGDLLSGMVPATAKAGPYESRVEIKAAGLPPRSVPLRLKVVEARPAIAVEPREIVLEADKPGIFAQEVRLRLTFVREVEVEAVLPNLAGKEGAVRAPYLSFTPAGDDWDGRKLAPGKDVRARFAVKVKSDHPNGDYEGKLTLSVAGAAEKIEIPVRLKVRQ